MGRAWSRGKYIKKTAPACGEELSRKIKEINGNKANKGIYRERELSGK